MGKQCFWYKAFGYCGKEICPDAHSGKIEEQMFSIVKVSQVMSGSNFRLQMKEDETKVYKVPRHNFTLVEKPDPNDWILFQASKIKTDGRYPLGRILHILKDYSGRFRQFPDRRYVREAFTVDPPRTKLREDAFNVKECGCKSHGQCFEVDVHITAVALRGTQKVNEMFLASFDHRKMWRNDYSFDKGRYVLALSVSFHTSDLTVCTPPTVTVVRVIDNYPSDEPSKAAKEFMTRFLSIFDVLNRDKWIGYDERLHRYITQYSEWWKPAFLCELLMQSYWKIAAENFKKKIGFISGKWERRQVTKSGQVILFNDEYASVSGATSLTHHGALLLAARGIRYRKGFSSSIENGKFRYVFGVSTKLDGSDDYRIQLTSPARDLFQFINQQILVDGILNQEKEHGLYCTEDLLGLMTVRFRQPQMSTALIESIHSKVFIVQHFEIDNLCSRLIEIPYDSIRPDDSHEIPPREDKKVEIAFHDVHCCKKNFINWGIQIMPDSEFDDLLKSMATISSTKPFQVNSKTTAQHTEAPYDDILGYTRLTLQPGVKIQLQISNEDSKEHNGLGVRLLRIGINCNLCLIHARYPEIAFLSRREDIRSSLLTKQSVENLKGRLISILRMKGVKIDWKGQYYGGGTFLDTTRTDEQQDTDTSSNEIVDIQKGDLLCIFAEFDKRYFDPEESNNYIWNCHGVVSKFNNSEVEFLTCSLSQTGNCDDKILFTVEVLRKQP